MKGIILAAGRGTRLYPLTKIVNKQLLQIYDKPMIYYPLSTLLLLGIKDILIITNPKDLKSFKNLLNDGSHLGVDIQYELQYKPNGIADAFNIGKKFINNSNVCLILGDNIFYGHNFLNSIRTKIKSHTKGAMIFGYPVNDPERYGVVEFSSNGKVKSIDEKPKKPKSNYAIPGLYIYDANACTFVKKIKPSPRNEYEITDLNKIYLKKNILDVHLLGRGVAWLDTGTPKSLIEASNFISYIEQRQGLKISCLEEIAYNQKLISLSQLEQNINQMPSGSYKDYLINFIETL